MNKIKHFIARTLSVAIIITSINMCNATDAYASNLSESSDDAVKSQEVVNTIADAVEHMADPEEFLAWTASEIIKELFKSNPMPGSKSEIEEIEEILSKVDTINSKLGLLSEKINQQETAQVINEFKQFDNSNNVSVMVKVLSDIDKDTTITADEKAAERKKLLLYDITNTKEGSAIQDELYSTAFDGIYDQYKAFLSTKYINADNDSMYIIAMYDKMLRTTEKWYHKYYKDKIAFQNYLVGKYMTVATVEKLSLTARVQEYEKNGTDTKARVLREKLAQIDKDVSDIQNIYKDNLAFEPDSDKRYYMYPGHGMVIYATAKEQIIPNEPHRDKGIQSERDWLRQWSSGEEPLSGLDHTEKKDYRYVFSPRIDFWRSFVSYSESILCPTVEWYKNVYGDYGSSKSLYDIFFDENEGNLVKPGGSNASWMFVADPEKGYAMKYQQNNFTADYVLTPAIDSAGKDEYRIIYKYHGFSNDPVLDYKFIGIGIVGKSEIEEPEEPSKPSKASSKQKDKKEPDIDLDTFKSELPSHSVLAMDSVDVTKILDMKVHSLDKTAESNQKLIADYLAGQLGKKAKIVESYGVYSRSLVPIGEDGDKKTLTWNNLSFKTPGEIYAVCYNQKDGAYVLIGTVNEKGTAVFKDFIYRDATNITLFVLE